MERLPELDDALQNAAVALDRRLIIMDRAGRVVAYSIHEEEVDRRRLFLALTHGDTWQLPRTGWQRAWRSVELPDLGPMVLHRLVDRDKHILGHLLIPAGDEATWAAAFWGELTAAAEQLGILMAAWQAAKAERLDRSHHLTAHLLEGDPEQQDAARAELLAHGHLSSSEGYCAVAVGVPLRQAGPESRERAALAAALTVRFAHETSTANVVSGSLCDGLGALVFPRPVVVERLTRILNGPEVVGVRAGIGPLTSLSDIRESFAWARLAWRATCFAPQQHPTVLTWDEAGIDGLLCRLPLEDFTVDDLPVRIRRLLGQGLPDEFLHTLQAYWDCGADAARTARFLRIHRSTLYYRMDRLRDAVGSSLKDGLLRTELHTGLRTAQLAGLVPFFNAADADPADSAEQS